MGPGRLTGMNVDGGAADPKEHVASMGPGRLTGMNAFGSWRSGRSSTRFNGARSIDRDERRAPEAAQDRQDRRFNGARSIDRDEREIVVDFHRGLSLASMGPGRLTGMNDWISGVTSSTGGRLQWGPVD